jgi:hypothetical protein
MIGDGSREIFWSGAAFASLLGFSKLEPIIFAA